MNYPIFTFTNTLLAVSSSKIVTGTQDMLNDASKAILIIAPIVAGIAIVFCSIRKMMADEHEAPMWKKRIIAVIVALVIAVSASGLVALFTSYYQ